MASSSSALDRDYEIGSNSTTRIVAKCAEIDLNSSLKSWDDVQSLLSQFVAPHHRRDDHRPSCERLNQLFDVPAAKTLWIKIVDPNGLLHYVNVSTGGIDWNPPNEEEGVVVPFDQLIGGFLEALDAKKACSEQPQSAYSFCNSDGTKGGENGDAKHGSKSRAERLQSIVDRLHKRRGGLDWWWVAKKCAVEEESSDCSRNNLAISEMNPPRDWVPRMGGSPVFATSSPHTPHTAVVNRHSQAPANFKLVLRPGTNRRRPTPYSTTTTGNFIPVNDSAIALTRNRDGQKLMPVQMRVPPFTNSPRYTISPLTRTPSNTGVNGKVPEVISLTSSDSENNNHEFSKRSTPKKTTFMMKRPNRPKNAYTFWLEENRAWLRGQFSDLRTAFRQGSILWKNLHPADKIKWEKLAEQDTLRYNDQMELFRRKQEAAVLVPGNSKAATKIKMKGVIASRK